MDETYRENTALVAWLDSTALQVGDELYSR